MFYGSSLGGRNVTSGSLKVKLNRASLISWTSSSGNRSETPHQLSITIEAPGQVSSDFGRLIYWRRYVVRMLSTKQTSHVYRKQRVGKQRNRSYRENGAKWRRRLYERMKLVLKVVLVISEDTSLSDV